MIRDLLKWVVPGLVTVLAGSTLTLAMTSADMAEDVAAQSTAMVQRAGFDWAELSFDTRDVTLSGTTTDQAYVDAAVKRLALIPGVRSVSADVTLAPMATPYTLKAAVEDGVIALSGGVPDNRTKQLLLARADLEQGGLELRSGMPERRAWIAGAQFAIDQLDYFDRGQAVMTGLTVDIDGRAGSERDFRDLLIVMRAGPPAGVALGTVRITPPLISPYQWSASFDGKRIEIAGYVPDQAMADRYRVAAAGDVEIATGLALGSGEPDNFAVVSQALVEQLSTLEYGSASIVDGQSTLTGAPPTLEIAQAVAQALQSAGSIVVLEPPRVDDYWVSATLQAGGKLVFDGYAPDAATRDGLQQRPGADTAWLQLGRGAPERYQSAMDFGLAALDRMSEGRFSLNKTRLTLTGVARSGEDYLALLDTLSESAPQGFDLVSATISAPVAAPYKWSATKAASGAISLSGMVPGPDARATLLLAAGAGASQSLTYASGEPLNFLAAAQTGMAMLDWLVDGQVVLDGSGWTITGAARSAIDKAAIEADFASRKLAAAGWSMAIAAPQPALAVAEPYAWSATRTPSGIVLAGSVPSDEVRQALAARAGENVTDSSQLAAGEPGDFAPAAAAAVTAVRSLDDAVAALDGSSWSLRGQAPSQAARASVLAALDEATDTAGWTIDVSVAAPAPAEPYLWSAIRMPDGATMLTGKVPTDALRRVAAAEVGSQLTDQTTVDPAAPDGFDQDVRAALAALSHLTDGLASFDGAQWRIDGNLVDAGSKAAIDTALASAATPATAWNLTLLAPAAVSEPAPVPEPEPEPVPEPAAEPVPPVANATAAPAPAVAPPAAEATVLETPVTTVVDPAYAFSATRSEDGAVIFSGQVPSDADLQALLAVAEADTAAVSIAPGAPPTFAASASLGLAALQQLSSGGIDFADGRWRIAGTAPDAPARDAVLAATGTDPASKWSVDIDIPAPVAETPAVPDPAPTSGEKVDISTCAGPIADFSGRNAILFQSGAALIATESEVALDELVILLKSCPDAVIHVEGHTDADGDAQLNLGLSVARAEAVVDALIARGINPERLYAVGYGETRPIADNTTSAGKRQNRRIVVTVSDEHF